MADGQRGSDGGHKFRDADHSAEGAAGPAPDLPLLEQVLQETLAGGTSTDPLRRQQWQALVEVARRHRGEALVLEPVAVDLVEALLRSRFDQLQLPADSWQHMSRVIATTLLDDPHAQARLATFWGQLSESVP